MSVGEDGGGAGVGAGFCANALGARSPMASASWTRMRLRSVTYPFTKDARPEARILGCGQVQVKAIDLANPASESCRLVPLESRNPAGYYNDSGIRPKPWYGASTFRGGIYIIDRAREGWPSPRVVNQLRGFCIAGRIRVVCRGADMFSRRNALFVRCPQAGTLHSSPTS